MENQYDVGVANRYALFLEEGENSFDAIKKKLSKEQRQRNKAIKKENAEAKKTEAVKSVEKPQRTETRVTTAEVLPATKREVKETKSELSKEKEKKTNGNSGPKNNKEHRDKNKDSRNKENNVPSVETTINEWNPQSDNPPPRKIYENEPRERKYDRNESDRPRSYFNQYKKNKDDWFEKEAVNDTTAADCDRNDENRNIRENEHFSDHGARGSSRFRGGRRGRGGNYNGGERRRKFEPHYNEQKDQTEANKNDLLGDTAEELKPQDIIENQNQKEEENKTTKENDDATENEQKEEVKEFLTLDEWKKLQGERQKPQYNLRKAGEGEDLTQWKNMRELLKDKEPKFVKNGRTNEKNDELDKENTANENTQRVARQKHIDIKVQFREPSARGRGGRIIRSNRFGYQAKNNEERGEDRSKGYSSREGRDNRNDRYTYGEESRSFRKNRNGYADGGKGGGVCQNAPKMDDEHAFPSLG